MGIHTTIARGVARSKRNVVFWQHFDPFGAMRLTVSRIDPYGANRVVSPVNRPRANFQFMREAAALPQVAGVGGGGHATVNSECSPSRKRLNALGDPVDVFRPRPIIMLA